MTPLKRLLPHWFGVACLFEVAPAALTGLLALVSGRPVIADFHWEVSALYWSIALTMPPIALFFFLLNTKVPSFVEIRDVLDQFMRKFFYDWPMLHIAALSILAGISEEMLFRGMIQGGLSQVLGTVPALIIASVLFGLVHFATLSYGIIATLIGFYLGGIWICSQNLLVPIAVHALYDFIALAVYMRRNRDNIQSGSIPPSRPPDLTE